MISHDNSYVKNQFLGPSRVAPLWALFSVFSNFFFPFFLFFFWLLIFFSFFLFQFISSFFDFLMFFIFFFHFFRRKGFFFSFFLYFFQIFLLLALVSEFNCFLRGRCSMEMWCPDDIGRDSWDWVGPPAWWRACFNSPEWGGGSSPVKTEPPQIVLLLLLCVDVVGVVCVDVVVVWCGLARGKPPPCVGSKRFRVCVQDASVCTGTTPASPFHLPGHRSTNLFPFPFARAIQDDSDTASSDSCAAEGEQESKEELSKARQKSPTAPDGGRLPGGRGHCFIHVIRHGGRARTK